MLSIQFFGSDIFSIKSLEAVLKVAAARPQLISKVQVVTRTQKPSGRGQNTIKDLPIVEFAKQNKIEWLEAETRSEFDQLLGSNPTMAIAVSYGKLIPDNYLKQLSYGGLNVHPSLLPTYRGAAPLHRAIMDRAPYTGVSVQTLDPFKFDRGKILWQSSEFPLSPQTTIEQLRLQLAVEGARGLETVLTERLFLGDGIVTAYPKSWAKVVLKEEHKLKKTASVDETIAQARALGKLYFEQPVVKKNKESTTRTIVSGIEPVNSLQSDPIAYDNGRLIIKMNDGHVAVSTVQAAGFKSETPDEYMRRLNKRGLKLTLVG